MRETRAIGASILVVLAVFFLLMASSAFRLFPYGVLLGVHTQPESIDMGYGTNGNDFLLSKDVDMATINGQSISSQESIIWLAVVFTNVTENVFLMAIYNASRLNAKTDVFIISQHDNITVNGNRMNTGDTLDLKLPLQAVAISYTNTSYIIYVQHIASLDDVPDPDREAPINATYVEFDLIRVALAGIPAVLGALGTCIIALAFIKQEHVQEGLPNEF